MDLHTGLVYDPAYLEHRTGSHPENPKRLAHTYETLKQAGVLGLLNQLEPRPAALDEVALVHRTQYIDSIRAFSERGGGRIDADTAGSPETYEVALLAAGGAVTAVEAVLEKKVKNAFALVRPPGHHAMPDRGMGFCFFNNIAVAARCAIQKYNLQRVLIVDWDEHHGNATEHMFYSDPSVLFFSVHRDWSFPSTGFTGKVGEGRGEGYNINVPLPARSGEDEYELVFREILKPVALEYRPELVLISAGMDAHVKDPVGQMSLTAPAYAKLAGMVCEIAGTCCDGALAGVLEGGYNPQALAESIMAVLLTMNDWSSGRGKPPFLAQRSVKPKAARVVEEVKKFYRPYWAL